jgi:hypothetical protein
MAINIKPANKGKLHTKMGIAQGKPIPTAKLTKAAKTAGPAEKKEITFAENARKWNHAKKPTETKTDRGTFGFK